MLHNINILEGYKVANTINGVKTVTQEYIDSVLIYASDLDRAREPILIHDNFDEVPQRFVNCLNSGSYVRPHMHIVPNQWELMSWISGEIIALIFDNEGTIVRKILMNEHNVKLIEIPPFCYHSFVAVGSGVYLEVRNCKYQPEIDRLYSAWTPSEGSPEAKHYQELLSGGEVGDKLIIGLL
jgi:cupin fold WbuC family metalloprotein